MSNSNEYAYAKEFDGNLRSHSVPVKVVTRLRIRTEPAVDDISKYSKHEFDRPPHYVVGDGNLPLHPSLQAMGRHYFTW